MIVTGNLKNIPISPKKLGRVAEVIKGHKAALAVDEILLVNKKGSHYIHKLLKSVIANAEHNFKLEPAGLVVSKIWVSDGMKGRAVRRYRFASRGRVAPYRKYRSNLYIELLYGK